MSEDIDESVDRSDDLVSAGRESSESSPEVRTEDHDMTLCFDGSTLGTTPVLI